jgi:hypothetical protein
MKRLSIIAVTLISLVGLAYSYNLSQDRPGRRPGGTTSRPTTTGRAEIPKGTALVKTLPEGAEGVVMEKGVIKIKPGYKFVKKDNTVTVMSMIGGGGSGGGAGVGGTWSCVCKQADGGCATQVEDNQIYCAAGGQPACSDRCVLSIRTSDFKSEIIRY